MIVSLAIGGAAGAGLLLLALAMVPPRHDLLRQVQRFEDRRTSPSNSHPTERGDVSKIGAWAAAWIGRRGWALTRLRADLALLDRTLEQHLLAKMTAGAAGLALPLAVVAVTRTAGVDVGLAAPGLLALIMAVGFSFLPDVSLRAEANRRRDDLRRALASYLDLVSMALAGGRGVPEALPAAANIGRGWAFEMFADTIGRARYTGVSAWQALRELGEQVDVTELRDLGNALSLVADDGAKVRESLQARAATARSRQLAEAAGHAEKAGESIRNAHLLLGFSFLLFLGFPAVAAVMAI